MQTEHTNPTIIKNCSKSWQVPSDLQMSSSWKTWSCKEKIPLSRTDPRRICICSSKTVDKEHKTKGYKNTPWYNKLWIFQFAVVLWVQNRWKQKVLRGIDEVTTWELDFKATAHACRIICQMKLEKFICILKIHFVLVLLHNIGICLQCHNWTKAYIMGHVMVCVVNSYGVMIHIFPPSDLFFFFFPSFRALIKDVIY